MGAVLRTWVSALRCALGARSGMSFASAPPAVLDRIIRYPSLLSQRYLAHRFGGSRDQEPCTYVLRGRSVLAFLVKFLTSTEISSYPSYLKKYGFALQIVSVYGSRQAAVSNGGGPSTTAVCHRRGIYLQYLYLKSLTWFYVRATWSPERVPPGTRYGVFASGSGRLRRVVTPPHGHPFRCHLVTICVAMWPAC